MKRIVLIKNDKYAKNYLDELAMKGIYDKETNSIIIKDKSNLSKDEYNSILTATTGNINSYSFAGEIIFYADAQILEDLYQNYKK